MKVEYCLTHLETSNSLSGFLPENVHTGVCSSCNSSSLLPR